MPAGRRLDSKIAVFVRQPRDSTSFGSNALPTNHRMARKVAFTYLNGWFQSAAPWSLLAAYAFAPRLSRLLCHRDGVALLEILAVGDGAWSERFASFSG